MIRVAGIARDSFVGDTGVLIPSLIPALTLIEAENDDFDTLFRALDA